MSVQDDYRARHPKSATLTEQARRAIPGGITHDIRHLMPYPVYIDRAAGPRKWDVDGHEYVDYWMGHGSLFLGHCHPAAVTAVQEQMARGTHLGACHAAEIRWAELVNQLIPCGELTRFTMSGTEATHLAMRVARAYTGRPKILKMAGHFHGWHDGAVVAVSPPYEAPWSAGVPQATMDQVVICPPNDSKAVEVALERGDIAGVILEPAGGNSGTTPTIPGYLAELREVTRRHNDPDWDRSQRVAHAGTFNANPLSAAAGIATLELCADASMQARANKTGDALRSSLAEVMKKVGVPGTCFGEASIFHVSFEGKPGLAGFDRPRKGALYSTLRCALLNSGVDCAAYHGWISATHGEKEIEQTVKGYEAAFRSMAADGCFKGM